MDVFVDVRDDVVVGVEEMCIINDNWCFFDLMYKVECFGYGYIVGFFVFDDFN